MSAILNADITTPPQPVTLLFLHNQLGYMGPTIIKPVLCLELDPWARALGQLCIETTLPGGGAPSCPSPWSDISRGRLDSRVYTSTPCIRNFSGKGSCPTQCPPEGCRLQLPYWSSRSSFRPSRVQAYSGHEQGQAPSIQVYLYKCSILHVFFSF